MLTKIIYLCKKIPSPLCKNVHKNCKISSFLARKAMGLYDQEYLKLLHFQGNRIVAKFKVEKRSKPKRKPFDSFLGLLQNRC